MWPTRFRHTSRPGGTLRVSARALGLVVVFLLVVVAVAAAAAGGEASVSSTDADGIRSLSGLVLETTVTGLTVQGRTPYEKLVLQDLDILYQQDERRFLPLLRILRTLNIDIADSAGTLTFEVDGAEKVVLDYIGGRATVGEDTVSVEVVAGVSDLTREGELYVHEDAVSRLLGLEVSWDPARYEYTLASDRKLAVFDRERMALLSAKRSARTVSFDLPGNLPPAKISRSIIPRLDFLRLRSSSSLIGREGDEELTGSFSPPRLDVWGRALGGGAFAAVSQKEMDPSKGVRVDRASWRSYVGGVEAELGTSSLGLSELAFPSINLVGLRVNGVFGAMGDERQRDPSQMGKRQTFQPTHVIEGHAPLGSEVKLEVNGREVDATIVEYANGAPPGEGVYRFEGINLFSSRLNEVRIVTTTPSGVVEETTREILGTNLLAESGQASFIAAAGGRRLAATDGISRQGTFAGGRVNYGVTESMTLGVTAAFQNDLYEADVLSYSGEAVRDTIPRRSVHVGSRLVWKPSDPLMVVVGAARSQLTDTSETDWAFTAGGELHMGDIRLYPTVYKFGPSFFDGSDPKLADVAGGSGSLVWRSAGGNELTLGASRSHDNLDGARDNTVQLSDAVVGLRLRTLIPRSSVTLGTNLVWMGEAAPLRYDVLGFDTNLLGAWSFRNRFVLGDDVRERMRSDLPEGAFSRFDRIRQQASRFDARSALGSSALTSRSELRRRLGRLWQLSVSHYSSRSTERSTIDLVRNAQVGGSWQWRLTPGYDWTSESFLLQNRIEYLIGGSRLTRGVFEVQLQDDEWLARLSLQVQFDVGFVDNAPVFLGDSRVNPDVGGVMGRVFVDFNGNGLPDSGEPGLPDIDVTSAGGTDVRSKKRGLFLIPNTSYRREATVSLDPETLPAIYTPTQATQDAILSPGMFTEVNLGVGAFGAISGYVNERREDGTLKGVPGLRVLLVDEQGQVVGNSFTASDGSYYLGEVRPGRYTVRVDEIGLPKGFELDIRELSADVFPDTEFYELEDMNLLGSFTETVKQPPADEGDGDENESEHETFE